MALPLSKRTWAALIFAALFIVLIGLWFSVGPRWVVGWAKGSVKKLRQSPEFKQASPEKQDALLRGHWGGSWLIKMGKWYNLLGKYQEAEQVYQDFFTDEVCSYYHPRSCEVYYLLVQNTYDNTLSTKHRIIHQASGYWMDEWREVAEMYPVEYIKYLDEILALLDQIGQKNVWLNAKPRWYTGIRARVRAEKETE